MATEVPEQYRSKAPSRLRDLAQKHALDLSPDVQQALLEAAAEIEGSEEAYAVLVCNIDRLREKLAQAEANLRATLALVPRTPIGRTEEMVRLR